ncbi:hypothetical protein [Cytobacillus sp. IB215665]|uniref:hypothetical protein n=1 Tax=Cytobacillus sp. IB215665 TaxID=3097357 RepID=UPI002A11792B|nr:hypothetical protein [Cytobacillus sp. IB215665]MDX8367710.1 hypothetical protein [Cytobacillus sp. IB215665]
MIKTITVPNRDSQGWLHGTKNMKVEWTCPTCGQEMGQPTAKQFCEDGEFYNVNVWENDCGHVAKYTDLKVIN